MKTTGRGKGALGRRSRQIRPLTALLRCACGSPMNACRNRYVCAAGEKEGTCERYSVSGELAHRAVLRSLQRAYRPLRASARLRERIERNVHEALAEEGLGALAGDAGLRQEQEALERKVSQALENLAEVPPAVAVQLGKKIAAWQDRIAQLEAELAQGDTNEGPDAGLLVGDALALLADLSAIGLDSPRTELRRLFERSVGRVVLHFGPKRLAPAHGRGGRPTFPVVGGEVHLTGPLAVVRQRAVVGP